MKIDLDDEPRSLLDFLNTWREKVAVGKLPGIPELSHPVEFKLLDLLTSQLDRELVSHNMIVAGLQRKLDGILQKGRELLEMSVELREEKLDVEEKLLSRLLELQKA